jgi:hypothetical protein
VVRVGRSDERELLTRKRESLKNVWYGREHGNLVPLELMDHLISFGLIPRLWLACSET